MHAPAPIALKFTKRAPDYSDSVVVDNAKSAERGHGWQHAGCQKIDRENKDGERERERGEREAVNAP